MFTPDWVDLATDERLTKIEAALPADKLKQRPLAALTPRIMTLPFYRDGHLVAFAEPDVSGPNDRYFLWSSRIGEAEALNWTNEPIYRFNVKDEMVLSVKRLPEYVRFFFHFVRGQLGRFKIVETMDEAHAQIRWSAEAGAAEKGLARLQEIAHVIAPLRYLGLHEYSETHLLTGTVLFKTALFKTDIMIAPYEQDVRDPSENETEHVTLGQIKLTNEDLILDELPIEIDGPPGEFDAV